MNGAGRPVCPMFCLIRHGQGPHNLCVANHTIHDPGLTAEGERQCDRLREELRLSQVQASVILCSPLRRTILTALRVFGTEIPLLLVPELKEVSEGPCNNGTSKEALIQEFPSLSKQLATLPDEWWTKVEADGKVRAQHVMKKILPRFIDLASVVGPVMVVSHAELLSYVYPQILRNCEAIPCTLNAQGELALVSSEKSC